MRPLCEPHILALSPYVPGRSIEESTKVFGKHNWIKLASNENPYGPSPKAIIAAVDELKNAHLYPNSSYHVLKQKVCQHHNLDWLDENQVIIGSGSSDIITLLARTFLRADETGLVGWPSFALYRIVMATMGIQDVTVPLTKDLRYDVFSIVQSVLSSKSPVKIVFIVNPNNPTGQYITKVELEHLFEKLPEDVIVVLDEAYVEYVTAEDFGSGIEWVNKRPRVVVLRTFSKVYGLAGLRVGYAIGDPEIISILQRVRDPFNVNRPAAAAAHAALDDSAHVTVSCDNNALQRDLLTRELTALGFTVTPSQGNFVLAKLPNGVGAGKQLAEKLLYEGIIVREVANYGLKGSLRITVGTAHQNERLLEAIAAKIKESPLEKAKF